MSELWTKIYDGIITYEKDWMEMGRCVEQNMTDILREYEGSMDDEKFEKLRDDFSSVASYAERESFYLGMKYAFRLFCEMMSLQL